MNEEELDSRIRSLVASAVADAAQPKPLPARSAQPASGDHAVVVPFRRHRGRMIVWTAVGVAASVVVGFVLVRPASDDNQRVTAATSSSVESTTIPGAPVAWPAEITAIVASDRGIETVTAENGEAVVTRLTDADGPGGTVTRGFVQADGEVVASYCCQEVALPHILVTAEDGSTRPVDDFGGVLMDVAADGAVLYVEGNRLMMWVDGVRTQLSTAPDGAGLRPEFHFQSDFAYGTWDRSLPEPAMVIVNRSGQPVDAGVVLGSVATATGVGMQEARLEANGQLWVTDSGGNAQEIIDFDPAGVVGLDVSWPYVLVSYEAAPPVLVALTGAVRALPMANGFATFSLRPTNTTTQIETSPTGEVRAVVTQRNTDGDNGVWALTADEFVKIDGSANGPAYLAGNTLVFSPTGGGVVAMDRTTGAVVDLRATGQVQDAAVFSGQLYYLYTDSQLGEWTSLYLHGPDGDRFIATDADFVDLNHSSWHLGSDVILGTYANYGGQRPEFYDLGGNFLADASELYAPVGTDPQGQPVLYAMSPQGVWGSLESGTVTLRQWGDSTILDTIEVPDAAQAIRFDVSLDRIVVSYMSTNGADSARLGSRGRILLVGDQGTAELRSEESWSWEDLPGQGWATLPRDVDPGEPARFTVMTAPPYRPQVALAGATGVRLIEGETVTTIADAPTTRVLLRRDGNISFLSPDFGSYPREWVRATGEIREHWAAVSWVAEPILHDDLGNLGDFLFSVADQVYRTSDERRWPAPGAADTRLSCAYNGWVIGNGIRFAMGDTPPPEWLGVAGGEWALSPDGSLVASTTDGVIRIRRTADGTVLFEQPIGDRVITQIDLNLQWLAIVETPIDTPNADGSSTAVLIHLASGRSVVYEGAVSASLPDTGL
ncbi:MAG: hypothetical protein LH616_09205 [Ilumatobacteraceae bacterium]|nr:hypothetical protein [Ilumatobacteraceae bacterium]